MLNNSSKEKFKKKIIQTKKSQKNIFPSIEILIFFFRGAHTASYDYSLINNDPCCRVGGGYFENGKSTSPFTHYDAVFFRWTYFPYKI